MTACLVCNAPTRLDAIFCPECADFIAAARRDSEASRLRAVWIRRSTPNYRRRGTVRQHSIRIDED